MLVSEAGADVVSYLVEPVFLQLQVVHHVLQSTVQYLCEQSPYDHPSTHAHFQDVVDNLQLQEDGLHKVRDHIRAGI